ncbi:MAG TPA: 50S ribosomal protein L24 [Spirochaetia bacterium]|nr:50S ribosomal protein L24 [Spirochaetia bacterium]
MKQEKTDYKLKKNDQVKVIAGKEKGKTGRVLRIDRVKGRVLIEGVNMVKKAKKKRSQTDQGGIIEIEAAIHISNVMIVAKNGEPSRVGYRVENGERVRFAKKTGEVL